MPAGGEVGQPSDGTDAVLDWQTNGPYTVRADIDLDGAIDGDDFATAFGNIGRSLGRGVLSHSSVANRRGYCGYEHDGVIDTLAHVRHRVLMTELGRWSRRDPLEGRHFDAAEPTSLRRVRLQTIVTERRFSLRGVACR